MTRLGRTLLVQALAVVTGLGAGALLIWVTGGDPLLAYRGLWEGSLGRPASISETLVWTTPYILAGLAVGLAFRGGLFNIGAEGQLSVGGGGRERGAGQRLGWVRAPGRPMAAAPAAGTGSRRGGWRGLGRIRRAAQGPDRRT
jgi:hypothetical protein